MMLATLMVLVIVRGDIDVAGAAVAADGIELEGHRNYSTAA